MEKNGTVFFIRCLSLNPPCGNRIHRRVFAPARCHSSKASQPVWSWHWRSGAARAACKWTPPPSCCCHLRIHPGQIDCPVLPLSASWPLRFCAQIKRLNCTTLEQTLAANRCCSAPPFLAATRWVIREFCGCNVQRFIGRISCAGRRLMDADIQLQWPAESIYRGATSNA